LSLSINIFLVRHHPHAAVCESAAIQEYTFSSLEESSALLAFRSLACSVSSDVLLHIRQLTQRSSATHTQSRSFMLLVTVTLQHTTTLCNTYTLMLHFMQQTEHQSAKNTKRGSLVLLVTLQHTATHCNTRQLSATHTHSYYLLRTNKGA